MKARATNLFLEQIYFNMNMQSQNGLSIFGYCYFIWVSDTNPKNILLQRGYFY